MERKYDVVLTFIMPNGQEVYAIWDIELYSVLKNKPNFQEFIFDGDKNGFGISPISVLSHIYLNPIIKELSTPMGSEVIIVGKKILLLDSF
jgi:hypothetical protein